MRPRPHMIETPPLSTYCCGGCGKEAKSGEMDGWRSRERKRVSNGATTIMLCSDACEAFGEGRGWFKPKPPPDPMIAKAAAAAAKAAEFSLTAPTEPEKKRKKK